MRMTTLRALGINLLAGARAALFLPVSLHQLRVSWSGWLLLALLYLLSLWLRDFSTVGIDGRWNANGLIGALFPLALLLVVSTLISTGSRYAWRTLPLLLLYTSLLLLLDVTGHLYFQLLAMLPETITATSWMWWFYYLPTLWLCLAASVAGMRLLELRWRYTAISILVHLLLLGLPLSSLWYDRSLWLAQPPSAAELEQEMPGPQLIAEAAFYRQPELLQEQLNRLQAQRPGVTDLYWLGIAGYASQDVFMKEVLSVEQLFQQRFDTNGRSLRLISNSASLEREAVASLTSLKLALNHIGSVMDREEDVLFLFLTSHGSAEQGFAFEFWPFELNNLQPQDLRQALDASGIKHRVLVVSACFSGIFVEPLQDPNTLVITAASADRNSFGCSNEAEFTYFGRAYFDEALRQQHSFITAFEQAKIAIAEREKQDGYESSQPQIAIGSEIGVKLKQLEQGWLAQHVSAHTPVRETTASESTAITP